MSFFAELKRRNVFRVAVAYLLAAWVLLQAIDFVLDAISAPNWILQVFILAAVAGFLVVLVFSWVFEVTPEGIKREKDIDRTRSITSQTGRKLDRTIIVFLTLAVVLLLADRFINTDQTGALDTAAEKGSEPFSDIAVQVGSAEKEKGSDPFSQVGSAEKEKGSDPFSTTSPKSIAVLPFADLSQAGDQVWFADGLAEEILNTLAKTPDLLVASRTSSFRYKDSTLDLPQIAAELGVAHVLEGSVRSSGDRIRVTAQLIRASDGFHLWSENYDRDVADMIAIQEDLALNIAQALETTMDPAALAEMTSAGTRSVAAYQEYLRGLSLIAQGWSLNSGRLYLEAYDRFEKARTIDPNFSAAQAMAADFWKTQLSPSRTDSGLTDLEPLQMLAEFNDRINLAIKTAPTEVDREGYLATRALFDLRLREAIRSFREYLQARPNNEQAWGGMLEAAALASDRAVILEVLEHFQELGQKDASAALSYVNTAYRYLDASKGADYGLQALTRWPTHLDIVYQTHRSLLWAGRILEAGQMADRYLLLNPQGNLWVESRQACAEGRRGDVEARLAAQDPSDKDYQSTHWHLLKLLGRDEEAADILQSFANTGVAYQMADWLTYHQFDPSPFPSIMAVLEREGVERPPAVDIPFKCPPADLP